MRVRQEMGGRKAPLNIIMAFRLSVAGVRPFKFAGKKDRNVYMRRPPKPSDGVTVVINFMVAFDDGCLYFAAVGCFVIASFFSSLSIELRILKYSKYPSESFSFVSQYDSLYETFLLANICKLTNCKVYGAIKISPAILLDSNMLFITMKCEFVNEV